MVRPHRSLQLVDPVCPVCEDKQYVQVPWLDPSGVSRRQLCPACVWGLPIPSLPIRTDTPRGVA